MAHASQPPCGAMAADAANLTTANAHSGRNTASAADQSGTRRHRDRFHLRATAGSIPLALEGTQAV